MENIELQTKTGPSGQDISEKSLAPTDIVGTYVVPEQKKDRRKFLLKMMLAMCAFYPQASCGLIMGMGGPAFLDLILITKSDIEKGSMFFTALYLGVTISCAVNGTLYDRLKAEYLMLVAICVTAAICIVIPFCTSIWIMAIVNGFRGVTMGIIFTGCGMIIVRVCGKKDSGPYMQALHFAFAAGGVIAPFIVRPFLAERQELKMTNKTAENITLILEGMTISEQKIQNNETVVVYYGETHVRYSFYIIGIITFFSALPFLVMTLKRYHVTPDFTKSEAEKLKTELEMETKKETEMVKMIPENEEKHLSVRLRVVFLVIITIYYILIVAVETLFQNYLMTFVVEYLKWTKARGTQISSVLWGAFSFGRFQGIFSAKLMTPWKILAINFLFLSVSAVVLLVARDMSDAVVWICAAISGVFVGSLFAGGVSYIEQRIMAITGKVYGICIMAATAGGMINPLLLGTLIEKYSPIWFVYFSVILAALNVILFTIMSIMVIKWGKKADPSYDGILDKAIGKCISKLRGTQTVDVTRTQ